MNSPFSLKNVAAAIGFFTISRTIFSMIYRKFRSHQENTAHLPQSSHQNSVVSSLSILSHTRKHQVFPSFHGSDVRRSLLSHILKEFKSKAIDLFIDNNIERSKSIGPELKEAIRGSRIAIVLLSKNYASSTWCLDELVEIIRCREVLGQTVMVLFYEVEPTDVKKQTGEFGKVFRNTCKGQTEDHIRRWKQALAEVSKIAGYHSRTWDNEAEMIENIAIDVSNELNLSTPSRDFDGLVGMESHMIDMEPLLRFNLEEVRMIGIWGPSGIGKTAIARFLFNQYSKDFQLSVFMKNIKAIPTCSDDYGVKLDLQEQFMSNIISQQGFKIPHLGTVEDRLKDKKVFVVLDDVDQLIQLEAMANKTWWFGPSSRIIITTQKLRLLQAHGVKHTHKVEFPASLKALQMFCMYAFDQKSPKDGFRELACEVTELAGKLPLGLRIMGSYFRGMSLQDWTTTLPRLRNRLDGEIESIIKFSYDALCDEDKRLFLHIACFFRTESVDLVQCCLANSFSDVTQGLRVLTEKSLVYVDEEKVMMNDLLVLLGKEIVRKQSISEPGKRQFLVNDRDIGEVLTDDKADVSKVLGLRMTYHDTEILDGLTRERAFERFSNLQFLSVNYGVNMLVPLPPKLRYLSWDHFEMPCFPIGFQTKFLVKLEMRWMKLEKLWEGIQPLRNLKWMDLSYSKSLKELPDLSTATSLCELHLPVCTSLIKLPSYIGNALHLQKLDLRDCSSLVELPTSMRNLLNLSDLTLHGCSKLEVNLTNINLESLEELDLTGCSLLKCHPETFTNIEDLKTSGNALKEVSSLMMRPLPLLSELEMSNSQIQELNPWIGRKSRLRRLVLKNMKKLVSLPQLPYSVTELDVFNCWYLERLDCSFRNRDTRLTFAWCFKLNQEARDLIIHRRTNVYSVAIPSREVPACFTYRASGSSLTVKLNHKPLCTSTKFKACILLDGGEEYEEQEGVQCTITSNQNVTAFTLRIHPYQDHLYIFEVEAEEVTSTELVFEFELLNLSTLDNWNIRECGVMQLLEVSSCDEHYKRYRDCGHEDMERLITTNEDGALQLLKVPSCDEHYPWRIRNSTRLYRLSQ